MIVCSVQVEVHTLMRDFTGVCPVLHVRTVVFQRRTMISKTVVSAFALGHSCRPRFVCLELDAEGALAIA
jgi:cytochrome b